MSSDAKFQESLILGTDAEDIVYSYLKANNSFVNDMRKQKHEDNRGPRLIGTEGELVLPDFGVINKNPNKGSYLLDVKFKTSVYTINGKEYFTVDRKFEQYKRTVELLRMDFLMMVFVFKNRLYFYKESEVSGTHQFTPNAFGDGFVYLFEFGDKKPTY